jgi:hypothetical protein
LTFGFPSVLFESSFQLFALGGLGHLRQGREYLLFREINILQRIMKNSSSCLGSLAIAVSPCLLTCVSPPRLLG